MRSSCWRTLSLVLVAVAIVLLANSYAEAQCAMCRAALTSATDSRFIHNFNIGVLVLLVPPATIFCSIFIVLRKYGPRMNADDTDQKKDDL